MKRWWRERSAREQNMMVVLTAIAVALSAYQFVLAPMSGYRAAAADSYGRAMEFLGDVEAGANDLHALHASSRVEPLSGDGALRTAVNGLARDSGLSITRLQPLDDGGLDIWVDKVEPTALFAWVGVLHEKHGVAVRRATIQKDTGSETVSGQISLAGGARP